MACQGEPAVDTGWPPWWGPCRMKPSLTTLFLLLGAAALPAHAAIIFGNLEAYTSDTTQSSLISGINYSPANPAEDEAEQYLGKSLGFTMGAEAYTVTTLTLRLDNVNGTTDSPTVRIYTNNGSNAPGTFVGGFINPATFNGTAETNYEFIADGTFTLNPSASYFIVVQQLNTAEGDRGFHWQNGSPTITPTGVANTPVARFGGGIDPSSHTQSSGQFNWFELQGNAVPEPSTGLLGALGMMALLRRRR